MDKLRETFAISYNNDEKNRMDNYSYDDASIMLSTGYFNGCCYSKFVLTQAPMKNTVDDFYTCIKEENIQCVINITQLDETDLVEYKVDVEYIRVIEWKDDRRNDIPDKQLITELISVIDKYEKVLVHCWAGIGRSATLICIYEILQHIRNNTYNEKTIMNTVLDLRKHRITALNFKQYMFLHSYFN